MIQIAMIKCQVAQGIFQGAENGSKFVSECDAVEVKCIKMVPVVVEFTARRDDLLVTGVIIVHQSQIFWSVSFQTEEL